MIADIESV